MYDIIFYWITFNILPISSCILYFVFCIFHTFILWFLYLILKLLLSIYLFIYLFLVSKSESTTNESLEKKMSGNSTSLIQLNLVRQFHLHSLIHFFYCVFYYLHIRSGKWENWTAESQCWSPEKSIETVAERKGEENGTLHWHVIHEWWSLYYIFLLIHICAW